MTSKEPGFYWPPEGDTALPLLYLHHEGSSNRILFREALTLARQGSRAPSGEELMGTRGRQTHLPEQHRQQQEDEDPHQQTDGDDPPHDVAPGLQVVQGLEDHLGGKAKVRVLPAGSVPGVTEPSLGLTFGVNRSRNHSSPQEDK